MEFVYPPVIGFARVWFAAQGLRFTIRGSEHVPRHGGAVMAINHISFLDFAYAGLAARPARRLVRFMAKEEVFRHPVAGPLMRGMHHIPVDRSAGSASFRAGLNALKGGEIVGIFPEATLSRSFELKEFKPGAVRMAQAAGVPLLPTIVWGSQRILSNDHRHLGRTRVPIHVYVGEPIEVAKGGGAATLAMRELRASMESLLAAAQDVYADRPQSPADAWWLPARLGGTAPTPEQAAELDARYRAARDSESPGAI